MALDSEGNLYIADSANHRIRKIDADGNISTVAGTGPEEYTGDGGPAVQAQLSFPSDVALDSEGNLYIADSGNDCIRKVDADTGHISTVIGESLDGPRGVALDGDDNLYIADTNNHRIRKIDAADGDISTVAGTGSAGDGGPAVQALLRFPEGVALDGDDNLYIADTANDRIRKVDADGDISTVAGTGSREYDGDDGPAVLAALDGPKSVALDAAGNLYIADSTKRRIRKVDAVTGNISAFAGTGTQGVQRGRRLGYRGAVG